MLAMAVILSAVAQSLLLSSQFIGKDHFLAAVGLVSWFPDSH